MSFLKVIVAPGFMISSPPISFVLLPVGFQLKELVIVMAPVPDMFVLDPLRIRLDMLEVPFTVNVPPVAERVVLPVTVRALIIAVVLNSTTNPLMSGITTSSAEPGRTSPSQFSGEFHKSSSGSPPSQVTVADSARAGRKIKIKNKTIHITFK
jgi:hypothetical protein